MEEEMEVKPVIPIGSRGKGWHGDSERHGQAGALGGITTSADREHMKKIGRLGGLKVSADRDHMAAIGRKGGSNKARRRQG